MSFVSKSYRAMGLNWIKTRYNLPEKDQNVIFLTESRMYRLGWLAGDLFYDRDNDYFYSPDDILFWADEEESLPKDFFEEQGIKSVG